MSERRPGPARTTAGRSAMAASTPDREAATALPAAGARVPVPTAPLQPGQPGPQGGQAPAPPGAGTPQGTPAVPGPGSGQLGGGGPAATPAHARQAGAARRPPR